MATSSDKTASAPSRRIVWLAVFIVAAIIAYSGLWFYLASQLESRSAFLIDELSARNVDAECDAMDVRGYPFRLGVFCDAVSADDRRRRATLAAGSFRSAAQVYRPNHIVSELDGPVTVTAGDGSRATVDWQTLRSSAVFGLSGLSRASLQSSSPAARLTPAGAADAVTVAADSAEFHMRQNNADLDAVLQLASATLSGAGIALPAVDLQADLTLADRAWLVSMGQRDGRNPWRDLSASLNALTADLGDGAMLTATGPFSIDGDGYLTGKFDLEISGGDAWQAALQSAAPADSGMMANAANIIGSMIQAQGTLSLPLNIERGRVTVGFLTLGQLPPV